MSRGPDSLLALALRSHEAGRLGEAEELYRRLLAEQPGNVNGIHLLGVLCSQAGRGQEAVALLRRAAEMAPQAAEVQGNLGMALHAAGQFEEAVTALRRAVGMKPQMGSAQGTLGMVLAELGRWDEAVAAYKRAIALLPNDAEVMLGLGNVYKRMGRGGEAMDMYRLALGVRADYPEALCNLGHSLWQAGKTREAVEVLRRALGVRPQFADAAHNLALALHDAGDLDEALAMGLRAAEMSEGGTAAMWNDLGNIYKSAGRLDEAMGAYRRGMERDAGETSAHSNLTYVMYFHPAVSGEEILEEHRAWNRRHAAGIRREGTYGNRREPERRLRIGYVSPDFCDHCQSFFTVPLLEHHDRAGFEVVCYSDVARPDAVTARIRAAAAGWRETAEWSDEQLIAAIQRDGIDVLVDLTMHMAGNRLRALARKPAPVQMTWLAYPGTTGVEGIEYRVTDPYLDPPENEGLYSERSLRLPETFWCYDPLVRGPEVGALPALGVGMVTFGCLNNFCKVNAGVLELWGRVLAGVRGSRLMVLCPRGSRRQWVLEGLKVSAERVAFVERLPRAKYLELYQQIDLGLDTFPYNGHTTSLDGLWMGVPTVTLAGRTAVSRAGYSQLSNMGLGEFVAWTPEEFVEKAARWAGDVARLAALRGTLRGRMERSPLMDGERFARNMERVYGEVWRAWCAG